MLVHPQFDPVAVHLGPLAVRWYGLTYLIGFGLIWLASATLTGIAVYRAGQWLTRRPSERLLPCD